MKITYKKKITNLTPGAYVEINQNMINNRLDMSVFVQNNI
jgi:hypothetical protein